MNIRYDDKGNILAAGTADEINVGQILSVSNVPEDFLTTFARGKYIVQNGEIVENPNFIDKHDSYNII